MFDETGELSIRVPDAETKARSGGRRSAGSDRDGSALSRANTETGSRITASDPSPEARADTESVSIGRSVADRGR